MCHEVVLKYPLRLVLTKIEWPAGSKPLCVKIQGGTPCLWVLALLSESIPNERVEIECRPTGESAYNLGEYIDTVLTGQFVWHFFLKRR